MQRIPPTTLLMILAVIGLVFGFWANQTEPKIEVVVDNTRLLQQPVQPVTPPPPVEVKPELTDPCGPFSRFSTDADCPPDTIPPEYPTPFHDEELGIDWDGVKVDGWDDGAPEWPQTNTAGADHYNDPRPDWLKNGD